MNLSVLSNLTILNARGVVVNLDFTPFLLCNFSTFYSMTKKSSSKINKFQRKESTEKQINLAKRQKLSIIQYDSFRVSKLSYKLIKYKCKYKTLLEKLKCYINSSESNFFSAYITRNIWYLRLVNLKLFLSYFWSGKLTSSQLFCIFLFFYHFLWNWQNWR